MDFDSVWRKHVRDVRETLLKALIDKMRYIDGRHHVLRNRGDKVPESLEQFTRYNVPEVSKNQNRTLQNLFEYTLCQLFDKLSTCLQAKYLW